MKYTKNQFIIYLYLAWNDENPYCLKYFSAKLSLLLRPFANVSGKIPIKQFSPETC